MPRLSAISGYFLQRVPNPLQHPLEQLEILHSVCHIVK